MHRWSYLLAASLVATATAKEKVAAKYIQENLTKSMWPAASRDKMVFVKLNDPNCQPCKTMQPFWDQLMAEYRDSDTLLICDVDCTSDEGKLCVDLKSVGFPTLRYGDPLDLKRYHGNRTYEAMAELAAGIGGLCRPWNLEHCSDKQKQQVDKYQAMTEADREQRIKGKDKKIADIEQAFFKFQDEITKGYQNSSQQPKEERMAYIDALTKQHDEEKFKKEAAVGRIKDTGLGILKAIHEDAKLPEKKQRMNLKKQTPKAVPMTKEEIEELMAKTEL